MTRAALYGRQSHGKEKRIADQLKLGERRAVEQGWEVVGKFQDKVGASNYSATVRDGWDEVRDAVEARSFDVLILWEQSRGDRDPGEWLAFLDSCRTAGIRIHIYVDDQTYDPRKARDRKTLGMAGIDSAYEVDLLSERAKSGIAMAAEAGKPHGGRYAPYGYRVRFDPETGERGYEVDPVTGPIVTWIISEVSKSKPIRVIIRSLEAREIPGPTGGKWYRQRIRNIALNPAYLGVRKHRDEQHPGNWPALTDPETFAAAGRVLNEPKRMKAGKHAKPGLFKNLLTYIATCTVCEEGVRAFKEIYGCSGGHVWIKRVAVDELVRDVAVARLSDPDLYVTLRHASEVADAEVEAARAEVATLTGQLEEWRASAVRGETTPASLAAIEAGLTERINAAQKRIEAAALPADLAGWTGPAEDVLARWVAAPVQARRTVVRALGLSVRIRPVGGQRGVPAYERVTID